MVIVSYTLSHTGAGRGAATGGEHPRAGDLALHGVLAGPWTGWLLCFLEMGGWGKLGRACGLQGWDPVPSSHGQLAALNED